MHTKEKKDYILSFDVGTNSIGYCAIDFNGDVIKKGKTNLLGSYIFEAGETALNTRVKRSNRRRKNHKKHLISLLQRLLDIDQEFINRMKESDLYDEDRTKSSKAKTLVKKGGYSLFNNDTIILNGEITHNFTDQKYNQLFPTVSHLINFLENTTQKQDIRLIYLALHSLLKARGHFLIDGSFDMESQYNVDSEIEKLKELYSELSDNNAKNANDVDFKKLLTIKDTREIKDKEIKAIIASIQKQELTKTDFKTIFKERAIEDKLSFLAEDFEEIITELNLTNTEFDLLIQMKIISDYIKLEELLSGYKTVSEMRIAKYEKHKKDLKLLKTTINSLSTYNPEKYRNLRKEMYADAKSYYKLYIKYYNQDAKKERKLLFDKIKKLDEAATEEEKLILQELIDAYQKNDFLPILRVKENSLLPNQLFAFEYKKVIENQKKFYSELKENEKDLLKLISFRIDYFVGPMSTNKDEQYMKNRWVVFNNNIEKLKLNALNYEKIIDFEATEKQFIERMLRKCTYFPDETVLPKQSLLYSRFMLLNELNNITVLYDTGELEKLTTDLKKQLIEYLFLKHKNVSISKMTKFLNDRQTQRRVEKIFGLSDNTNVIASLEVEISFRNILLDDYDSEKVEEIIELMTIFEGKEKQKQLIVNKYPEYEKYANDIVKIRIAAWGNLSKKLLIHKEMYDGTPTTILDLLENTQKNFMEIINESPFKEFIETGRTLYEFTAPKERREQLQDTISDLYLSPAVRKMIVNVFDIYNDVVKYMKSKPKYIGIEMAKEDGEKGKTTVKKDVMLKNLLKDAKQAILKSKIVNLDTVEYNDLFEKLEKNSKVYRRFELYCRQLGYCMYTGEKIDFNKLTTGEYQVDHILPRSIVKNDSIDNLVLVKTMSNQRKADESALSFIPKEKIQKVEKIWEFLYNHKFISSQKYQNLKIKEFDEETLKPFIARQLVETRQSTKVVLQLFKDFFEYEDKDIFAVKGQVTSEIRNVLKFPKIRDINDYHHAYDAYIVSLMTLMQVEKNMKNLFSQSKPIFSKSIREYFESKVSQEVEKEYSMSYLCGMFLGWGSKKKTNEKTILNKMNIMYTNKKFNHVVAGSDGVMQLFNETLMSPHASKNGDKTTWVPLKKGKDVSRYGYYSSIKPYMHIYYSIDKTFTDLKLKKHDEILVLNTIEYLFEKNTNKLLDKEIYEKKVLKDIYENIKLKKQKVTYDEFLEKYKDILLTKLTITPRKIKETLLLVNDKQNYRIRVVGSREISVRENYFLTLKNNKDAKKAYRVLKDIYYYMNSMRENTKALTLNDYFNEYHLKQINKYIEANKLLIFEIIDDIHTKFIKLPYLNDTQRELEENEYKKVIMHKNHNFKLDEGVQSDALQDVIIYITDFISVLKGGDYVRLSKDKSSSKGNQTPRKFSPERKYRKSINPIGETILKNSDVYILNQSKSGIFKSKKLFVSKEKEN